VGPEEIGQFVRAPVRREVTRTGVRPNVPTAGDVMRAKQQRGLNQAKLAQGHREFLLDQMRREREFGVQENRLDRKLYLDILEAGAGIEANQALANLRQGRNRRELAAAQKEDWDTYANTLANILADPWTDEDQELGESRLGLLPPGHQADVRERAAARRSEIMQKAAGTGTVTLFDAESESGTREISGRDFLRMHPGGAPGKPTAGMKITTTPGGDTIVETGVATGLTIPSRTMTTTLQEAVRTGVHAMARLRGIDASYDPYFLEYMAKGRYWHLDKQIKAGRDVPAEDHEFVTRYRQFAESTLDNLARYIKDITGAQMSEAEAKRLTKTTLNLDLNSVAFEASWKRTVREMKLQIARNRMLLQGGFGDENIQKVLETVSTKDEMWDRVPMAETLRVMMQRERFHQEQVAKDNSTWAEGQVEAEAQRLTEEEFGVSFEEVMR
jgi:hypothetical protein